MALGFIKKVFSFGKKEVEERPAEDEPLAPLNFDAIKQFAAEAPPSPLKGEVSSIEAEYAGGAPETPEPQPVEVPEPAEPVRPAVPEEPVVVPPIEPLPPKIPEVPPAPPEPARPTPVPPAVPELPIEVPPAPEPPEPKQPEPAPEQPIPPPPAIPERPVETPPSPPIEVPAVPTPIELPPGADAAAPTLPSPWREAEGRARPVARPEDGEAGQGGVVDAALDIPSTPVIDEPVAEVAPRLDETLSSVVALEPPSSAEATSSSPSEPLPLKRGEGVSPPVGKVTVGKSVEKKAEPQIRAPTPEPRKAWFQRLREGLSRSSRELSGSIAGIFTKRKLDEETLEELEDVLIRADLGMETALRVTDTLSSSRYGKDVSDTEVRTIMAQEVEKVLTPVAKALELDLSHKPHVILVVGVNGTGKTTTIGKLAAKLRQGGLSVMLAAGDTFRAAAIEQLKIWGERTGSPVVSSKLGADAAGLAWDAFEKAKEAGSDVLIIDTAGRLHNRTELMAELEKIVRVLGKHDPEAPHTVLQTVDATTGQNALNQVEIFRNVAGVNGLVMTKLDGTARGGILVAIAAKHKLPVYFIGVGEQVDDLEPFSASDFAKAIAGVA